ncbi:hypothetical protein Cpir12675_002972 [Ceratocystis pirilliformis]|uniref:LysM domain-containing protein n=1 Tax=Ceratocystis pirilliformis TaxID=259994 RepID=A0ABR3Z5V9_9PEZI
MIFFKATAFAALLAPLAAATRNSTSVKPSSHYDNEVPGCTSWYVVKPSDTCQGIADSFQVPYDNIYSLNPDIDATCTNLLPDIAICLSTSPRPSGFVTSYLPTANATTLPRSFNVAAVETSAPQTTAPTFAAPPADEIRSGVVPECKRYYQVIPGDTCESISLTTGIALTDFMRWNNVAWSCKDLALGSYVCVGV